MHEYAITRQMLDTVLLKAKEKQARRVIKIHLLLGEASGVAADNLRFYFGLVSKGSIAEGAGLAIEEAPLKGRCLACGHTWQLRVGRHACPVCSKTDVEITGARDLIIESIEAE